MNEVRPLSALAAVDAEGGDDSQPHPILTSHEARVVVGPLVSPQDPATYTVEEFCRSHGMSRSYFYEVLIPVGAAPAMTKLGRHRSITREAAAAWRTQWTGRTLPSRPKRMAEIR